MPSLIDGIVAQHRAQGERHITSASGQPRLFAIPAVQLPAANAMQPAVITIAQHDAAIVLHARDEPSTGRTERGFCADAIDLRAVIETKRTPAINRTAAVRIVDTVGIGTPERQLQLDDFRWRPDRRQRQPWPLG